MQYNGTRGLAGFQASLCTFPPGLTGMTESFFPLSGRRIVRAMVLCLLLSFAATAQDVPPEPIAEPEPPAQRPLADDRLDPAVSSAVDPNTYKIGAGDVVSIRVWREPELTTQQTVRPDGKITMPLIGDVVAVEMTPNQIAAQVTGQLKEYIVNPSVVVAVIQVRSKKYTITGEIGRPGSYPLLVPTTVLDAITNAGGFRDFANRKKITILRGDERFKFNYNDVIKGKNREQNIELRDGDLIVVP